MMIFRIFIEELLVYNWRNSHELITVKLFYMYIILLTE